MQRTHHRSWGALECTVARAPASTISGKESSNAHGTCKHRAAPSHRDELHRGHILNQLGSYGLACYAAQRLAHRAQHQRQRTAELRHLGAAQGQA